MSHRGQWAVSHRRRWRAATGEGARTVRAVGQRGADGEGAGRGKAAHRADGAAAGRAWRRADNTHAKFAGVMAVGRDVPIAPLG